ncbi:MAG: translation initiation factor IF-2 [Pseudomonadota bacterium]
MTKTRVHELAKDIGWDSKDLVERLIKDGFSVKSHQSTLDDAQVIEIKEKLLDLKSPEVIVEKRIRPSVIRRRRQVLPSGRADDFGGGDSGGRVEAAEKNASESDIEAASAMDEFVREQEPERPRKLVRPQRDSDRPARIIRRPELPAPAVPEAALTRPASERPSAPVAAKPPGRPVSKREASETTVEAPVAEKAPSKAEPAVRARRREEPARIIKMPEKQVQPASDAAAVGRRSFPTAGAGVAGRPQRPGSPRPPAPRPAGAAVVPPAVPPSPESEAERRKKKRRPGTGVDDRTRQAAAKLRKREVFDKAQLYGDDAQRGYRPAKGGRRAMGKGGMLKRQGHTELTVPKAIKRRIRVADSISVGELAKRMGIKGAEVIKKLMHMGVIAMINQAIDFDAATLVAGEFGYELERSAFEEEGILQAEQDRPEEMLPRPPVVTIMGHVDHGKTSLLDAIRETNVTSGEAGGITQHIGAYHVKLEGGDVVFLDTPGHEAFTAMRARGAQVTDVVVLVVAADDGVMGQTVEAINHARAAQVPILVAINKIDKPGCNPDRVKKELADHGLIPEEWGGETVFAEVSAKMRRGITELLELILLQAEILELKANPDKLARGRVIEARLDKGRGPVATVLVQEGTLRPGDALVCGTYSGRVRAIFDEAGNRIDELEPGLPGEVQGLGGIPLAGDDFVVLEDERKARQVAAHRQLKVREKELASTSKISLEKLYERIKEGKAKELNLVLRTDVQGSLEALQDAIAKLPSQEVKVQIIHAATGGISETDIMLASASDAIIIGFGVRPGGKVAALAEQERVDVRYYDVIYQLIGEIRDAMTGLLEPVFKEKTMGRAEVRNTFSVPKVGTVAGCYITDGKIERSAKARLLRDGVVVFGGKLGSLRRFKEDVKEVTSGYECGIGLENFNDIKVGDVIEAYSMEQIKAELEDAPKAG